MCLSDYVRVYQDLAFKRSMFPSNGSDWDYYTYRIDSLLAEAQDTLTDTEFDKLLEYV